MIKNEYGISKINIAAESKNFCPLGNDWYTNKFDIVIGVGDFIPDYCDVDGFIDAEINGREMIIEQAVKVLHDFIVREYSPKNCVVRSSVTDAAHSAVVVEKIGGEGATA